MKNNIRYNGNINNTSVIIFLNRHLRHFFTFLFMSLGEPPGGFCDVGCCCCFYFTGGFPFHCFSTSSLTLPWAIAGFTPILYFQPSSLQSDSRHFHFNFSGLFIFTTSATVLSEHFLPTGVFLPYTLLFVTQMWAGTPHPGSSSVPVNTELSLPADARPWTIDVWIIRPLISLLHQWAAKYRVNFKLLNIFLLVQSHM